MLALKTGDALSGRFGEKYAAVMRLTPSIRNFDVQNIFIGPFVRATPDPLQVVK
jgi:hypothetical protein